MAGLGLGGKEVVKYQTLRRLETKCVCKCGLHTRYVIKHNNKLAINGVLWRSQLYKENSAHEISYCNCHQRAATKRSVGGRNRRFCIKTGANY